MERTQYLYSKGYQLNGAGNELVPPVQSVTGESAAVTGEGLAVEAEAGSFTWGGVGTIGGAAVVTGAVALGAGIGWGIHASGAGGYIGTDWLGESLAAWYLKPAGQDIIDLNAEFARDQKVVEEAKKLAQMQPIMDQRLDDALNKIKQLEDMGKQVPADLPENPFLDQSKLPECPTDDPL